MSFNATLFAAVFVVAAALFAWSCFRRFRLVTLGKAENRFDNIGKRIWSMLLYPLAQRCTITRRYSFGLNHAVLFWCFVLLLIANTEFLLHGLFDLARDAADGVLELPHAAADGPADLGQTLGAEEKENHQKDDRQLRKAQGSKHDYLFPSGEPMDCQ